MSNDISVLNISTFMKKDSRALQAGLIGMTIFLITCILNQIPSDFHWFVLHQNLKNFSFFITGGVQVLIWETLSVFIYPSEYLDYFYTSIGSIIGFAIGILGYWLWVKQWIGKAMVILLVLANTIFSGFILFLGGFFVRPADGICKISMTDDLDIRVIGYDSIIDRNYDNYAYYFVLSSINNGQTWEQVMGQSYDAWDGYPPPPDCEGNDLHFGKIDDEFLWFWTKENLSVSQDGGQSWQNWQPSCGVREDCDYGGIISVAFDDPQHGRMEVYLQGGKSKEIFSSDGGITWEEL